MAPNPVPGVLCRIGQHGRPAALPWRTHFIHSSNEEVRAGVEQAVESLLKGRWEGKFLFYWSPL